MCSEVRRLESEFPRGNLKHLSEVSVFTKT
ncbi:hypothetical protein DENIT_80425 [Pseudomonas veronii]|nr:hypothetical protein DENIT_80425 [Pseudomonas veronii]